VAFIVYIALRVEKKKKEYHGLRMMIKAE